METIFLSYGFRDEERDLATVVERLLESHDIRAMTGEVLEGQPLTDAVKRQIAAADGLIALLAPRDPHPDGGYRPSSWVRDELQHARAIQKPALAFKHKDVAVEGMGSDAERVDFDPHDLAPALLRLSAEIGAWKRSRGRRVKVRVLPTQLEDELGSVNGGLTCRYKLTRETDGAEIRNWGEAPMRLEPGGAFVYLDGVQRDALIELQIQFPAGRWNSRATPQWLHVELKRG